MTTYRKNRKAKPVIIRVIGPHERKQFFKMFARPLSEQQEPCAAEVMQKPTLMDCFGGAALFFIMFMLLVVSAIGGPNA